MEKMMKKLMFAVIAAVFCSSLMANVLIYDYAASFKRVDVTGPVKVKDGSKSYTLDSPKVASDKFTGYVVIAECRECNTMATYQMLESANKALNLVADRYPDDDYPDMLTPVDRDAADEIFPGNYAVVYIKRNGGNFKYAGNTYALKNEVYRAIGRFYVDMFGAKSGKHYNRNTGRLELVNGNKFTDAAGFLSYRINANGNNMQSDTTAGFLGIGQTGIADIDWWWFHNRRAIVYAADYDTVDNAGFGKVYLKKNVTPSDCWTDEETAYCWRVKNLSGSMLGGFTYTAVCSDFLFDICNRFTAAYAPISGTFTLKINNSLSFPRNGSVATFRAAEDAILNKMNVTVVWADPAETLSFNSDPFVVVNTATDALRAGQVWNGAHK